MSFISQQIDYDISPINYEIFEPVPLVEIQPGPVDESPVAVHMLAWQLQPLQK